VDHHDDLQLVRRAVAAYFRAAAAYGTASLLLREAAAVAAGQHGLVEPGDEHDDEFLLERAATYRDKALLMSESGAALLRHSDRWFAELELVVGDLDDLLTRFATEIQQAADATAEVAAAVEATSFAEVGEYPELLDQLRFSVQFLNAEAAIFAAVASGEMDESSEDEEGEEPAAPSPAPTGERGVPRYDRRVPEALVDALAPGGPFGWVTALARRPVTLDEPPLDLGLRASPKVPGAGHATLYLGTTQVLKLELGHDGNVRLRSHQRGGLFGDLDPPFDGRWGEWQPLAGLADATPAIAAHVRAAVAGAPAGRQVEGRYQAALAKPSAHGFALVDREIQLIYDSDPDRRSWEREWREPFVAMQQALAREHRWAAKGEPPGRKLDALAIAADGRLLAIEVKPGAATRGVTWTPLQVAVYLRMLRAWIGPDHDAAAEILEDMLHQRVALGLVTGPVPRLRVPIEVVPVIAIGKPLTSRREAPQRFAVIREALARAGEPLDGLQLWAIEETGDVSAVDAQDLDDPRIR
jgi:hypothetical protein